MKKKQIIAGLLEVIVVMFLLIMPATAEGDGNIDSGDGTGGSGGSGMGSGSKQNYWNNEDGCRITILCDGEKVYSMGRLTRDPELRKTPSDIPVAVFTLAVDRDFKGPNNERETDFIDIETWRSTAEFVNKYFTKGRMQMDEDRATYKKRIRNVLIFLVLAESISGTFYAVLGYYGGTVIT